ncbi:MAG: hypothetical protein ABI592_06610 [Acidobacteriota bacterium]
MTALRRLDPSKRFGFRFLCAAWFAGSFELLRRWAITSWPPERPATGSAVAFFLCAVAGAFLLWRTRESGARELLESSAALGFWASVVALVI